MWLAFLIATAEVSHGLPPGILAAVVLHESNGRANLVTPERRGGCSVGLGQVYLPGCPARLRRRLVEPSANLAASAALLAAARRRCGQPGAQAGHALRCCRPHWVQGYNCGSPGYAERVLRRWRRLVPRETEATCRRTS